KKFTLGLSIVALMALSFSSCSSDDDNDDTNCESCDLQGQSIEICDNGNDTYTITTDGQSETISADDLEGIPPAEYIGLICTLGDLVP
ncbi:MAG: hypothetical protein WBN69_00025, partial [Eudoraea sp.]